MQLSIVCSEEKHPTFDFHALNKKKIVFNYLKKMGEKKNTNPHMWFPRKTQNMFYIVLYLNR